MLACVPGHCRQLTAILRPTGRPQTKRTVETHYVVNNCSLSVPCYSGVTVILWIKEIQSFTLLEEEMHVLFLWD